MENAPNYHEWTDDQLVHAFHKMNRQKFPEHFETVKRILAERGIDPLIAKPAENVVDSFAGMPEFPRALRRFAAFSLDVIFVTLLCLAFFPFSSLIQKLGVWAYVISLLISVLYFAIGDSKGIEGQTLGKKLLKIRVISDNGGPLSLSMVLLRAVIVTIVFNKSSFSPLEHSVLLRPIVETLISLILIGQVFIFLHPQRRSVLDILTKSIVVRGDVTAPSAAEGIKSAFMTTKAAVFVIAITALMFAAQFWPEWSREGRDLNAVIEKVNAQSPYKIMRVTYLTQFDGTRNSYHSFSASVFLPYEQFSDEKNRNEAFEKLHPLLMKEASGYPVDEYVIQFFSSKFVGFEPTELKALQGKRVVDVK